MGPKSCGHVIAREIEKFLKENQTIVALPKGSDLTHFIQRPEKKEAEKKPEKKKKLCPDCGAEVTLAEGCIRCDNCGYSKC